jgi:hypothetical protein
MPPASGRAAPLAGVGPSTIQGTAMAKLSISPMLSVRRGAQAIEFYKKAFDARELFRLDNESGEVVAQLAVGEAEFWVADESPENKNFSPESLGGGTVRLVMVADDPDRLFKRGCGRYASLARSRPGIWMARWTPCRPLRPPLGNRQAARIKTIVSRRSGASPGKPRPQNTTKFRPPDLTGGIGRLNEIRIGQKMNCGRSLRLGKNRACPNYNYRSFPSA